MAAWELLSSGYTGRPGDAKQWLGMEESSTDRTLEQPTWVSMSTGISLVPLC